MSDTTRPAVCSTCGWPPVVSVSVKRAGDVRCPTCGYRRATYTADEGTSGFVAYPEQAREHKAHETEGGGRSPAATNG